MLNVIIPVLIISLIGAFLALLLVIAERFISNYGICKIDINNEKQIEVQGGQSLLSALNEEDIFIPSACGGKGTCGYCKLKVNDGGGLLLPTETPFLTEEEQKDNIRLSCQVKIRNDIFIEIPKEILSVRQYEGVCKSITDLTHDIKLFRIQLDGSEQMDYIPGQYVQLFTPVYQKGGEEVYRAYSIASDPKDKSMIELIIRLVPGGICTTYCFEYLNEGDSVKFNGPYGDFQLTDNDTPMIFIAGGSGMAPIRCMLYQMKNEGIKRKATYFFGANRVSELFMRDEMELFEKELHDYTFVPVVSGAQEDWDGQSGLVTDAVYRSIKDNSAPGCEAYLCGSPGMIEACEKVLIELGMPESSIFYDSFA